MARPTRTPDETASRRVRFRVTETVYVALEKLAAEKEFASPHLFLRAVAESLVSDALPRPAAEPPAATAFTQNLRHLAERLRADGRALNRLAKRLNATGEADDQELHEVRAELHTTLGYIVEVARPVSDPSDELRAAVDALAHQARRVLNNVDQLVPALFAADHPAAAEWHETRALVVTAHGRAGAIAEPAGFRNA